MKLADGEIEANISEHNLAGLICMDHKQLITEKMKRKE